MDLGVQYKDCGHLLEDGVEMKCSEKSLGQTNARLLVQFNSALEPHYAQVVIEKVNEEGLGMWLGG